MKQVRQNIIILLLTIFGHTFLSAQTKGGEIINADGNSTNQTYAVVVGISDYQHEKIPDLKYAERDAEAFANFLRSPAGGSLDDDHIKLLVGPEATMAHFAISLDWLMEVVSEGDDVIIYFSGHGDVERKTFTQPGYLLCWDAPAQIYLAGGAFNVRDMKDIISTLSTQNKAKVLLITDACRSGKLSGSSIGGTQATTMNLMQQFSNEIKILSCQPNEYSIEGEQWGQGRGAFSYHLINGLYGLADQNGDLSVDLMEIQRYLQDHVSKEVAPLKQIPVTVGDYSSSLSTVDAELLEIIRSEKDEELPLFAAVEYKGFEDQVLEIISDEIQDIYSLFKESLAANRFLHPENDCAEYYYQKLIENVEIQPLHSTIKRNYAAALQDEAQQVMNLWLAGDEAELNVGVQAKISKYSVYPAYLNKAASILGNDHYMYNSLMARMHFWSGYILTLDQRIPNPEVGKEVLHHLDLALDYAPELTFVDIIKSLTHGIYFQNVDSLKYYTYRTIENHPNWILAYTTGAMASLIIGEIQLADSLISKVEVIDSNNLYVLIAKGYSLQLQNKLDKARRCFEIAYALDSTSYFTNYELAWYHFRQENWISSEKHLDKLLNIDSSSWEILNSRGMVYFRKGEYDKSEKIFEYIIANFPDMAFGAIYNQSIVVIARDETDRAFELLEESLKKGMTNYFDHVLQDPDMEKFKEHKERWDALIEEYKPDRN